MDVDQLLHVNVTTITALITPTPPKVRLFAARRAAAVFASQRARHWQVD
jgi:hypothetical protein